MAADHPFSAGKERRVAPELRTIFVEACEVIRPFFNESNRWAGHSLDHLAFRALRERFPAFSDEQIFIVVSAARRVFGSGGTPAP